MLATQDVRRNLTLAGACLVVGLALFLRWTPNAERVGIGSGVSRDVSRDKAGSTVQRLEEEQKSLKAQIEALRKDLASYQQSAGQNWSSRGELTEELERQKLVAGLVAVVGPGVKVVLDDSTKNPAKGDDVSYYLVHDYQLRDVLNALWQAGAEAVSLNGERVVGSTSIYCVGSTIMVNSTRLSPPYEFLAIGNQDALADFLNRSDMLGEIKVESKNYGLQFILQKSARLPIPAYNGVLSAKYAKIGGSQTSVSQ